MAIVWLYRDESDKFLGLVSQYLGSVVDEGLTCFDLEPSPSIAGAEIIHPLLDFRAAIARVTERMSPFVSSLPADGPHMETWAELQKEHSLYEKATLAFQNRIGDASREWEKTADTAKALGKLTESFAPLAETSRDLVKHTDLLYKLTSRLIEICESECNAKDSDDWSAREVNAARKSADETRAIATACLKQVRYFWRQAHWLVERFPDARLRDVEGLVKLVDHRELAANDWSLTPGRYVGVAPEEVDEDFDFEEAIREIHVELEDLNSESVILAKKIKKNFEELGI